MMHSSNPALPENTFRGFGFAGSAEDRMTIGGTVVKTLFLLLSCLLTAGWTWFRFYESGGDPASVSAYIWMGAIGGLVFALITAFKKEWAPYTSVCYALLEGFVIGGLSAVFEAQFSGIVIQAVGFTFGTLAAMLMAYQSGLIQPTQKFKLGVIAATGGIALVYFVSIILSFFGITVPFIYGNSLFSILFSLFVVVIAALNFIIDFDFIEKGSRAGAPRYMEWYGAFALMVTLVWLYIEFLRLLSKIRSR